MSDEGKHLLDEISLELLNANPSFMDTAYITQVHEYFNDHKVYLFYIYFPGDEYDEVSKFLTDYLETFSKEGHNTPNVYEPDIIIIKGAHELISHWETMTLLGKRFIDTED